MRNIRIPQVFTLIRFYVDPIFRRISAGYKEDKTKATSNFHCLSPSVESPYKLSNRFIEDLQKIHDYITYFHIDITRTVKSKIS